MLFFGIFIIYIYKASSEKTCLNINCLKKGYYYCDEQIIRNFRYCRSLFCNILRADDHWEVILDLKSAASCMCISK